MKKKLLFIVEENVINGKLGFGASNDLLLIIQALKMEWEVYLTTPKQASKQAQLQNFPALKLSENLDQKEINQAIKNAWHQQIINCLLALKNEISEQEKSASKILFSGSKMQNINLQEVPVFNRSEPISLTDKFYDLLIGWQKKGIKILPNASSNKILGDKFAINSIHNNTPFQDLDLLANIKFQADENKISFETKIINLSQNNLSSAEIVDFYDLLDAQKFKEVEKIFGDEYKIFKQGAEKYLKFHQKLNNDSIIKPASYFGGTGIVVAKNKTLNLSQAIQNIVQSFFAIKQDCQKNKHPDLAFLPAIIVQERATEAHLGDLRIVFCGDFLQGIFVRVNPDFAKSKANNLHFGGHPESLFKHYPISKVGIDLMIEDMKKSAISEQNEEIKKVVALYNLLETLAFLKQIKTFSEYPIIGVDALLTKDSKGNYRYGINEINLTSPMGQTQLLLLEIAIKFSNLAAEILQQNGFKIHLEKYQILADFFKTKAGEITLKAQETLLRNHHLQVLIGGEIETMLANNFATKTLQHFTNQ